MAPFPAMPMFTWLLLAIGSGGGTAKSRFYEAVEVEATEDCPRCDVLFSMLETTSSGKRVQNIKMQERGEPKSGTTFMYHWAHGALLHTCNSLNDWFGSGSCRVKVGRTQPLFKIQASVEIIFEPRLAGADARCSCPLVDMVKIFVSDSGKHTLPVGEKCSFQHTVGVAKDTGGCSSVNGRPVEKFEDIVLCMEEAECNIADDSLQFVIMRDPRPQAVSTFYHEQLHPGRNHKHSIGAGLDTVDDFVLAALPTLCQWMSLRYAFFTGPMAQQSTLFWYDDAVSDALTWHHNWLASVGLNLPEPAVEEMVQAATSGDFAFETRGRNAHPGEDVEGAGEEDKSSRSWREEINPELMEEIEDTMRQWLPPEILARLEVFP